MASFPKNEANMLILGRQMVDGFEAKADLFPSPPVTPGDLENALEGCVKAREAAIEAQAAAEQATVAKNTAFEAFAEKMKVDLRYAEDAVNYDDAKLRTIGWGGRKPATRLTVPGQTRNLAVREHGESSVQLVWMRPVGGGRVNTYQIQRRERTEGDPWTLTGIAMETETMLSNQPRGKELEYCVIATNKAGDGPMSNSVTVVL
uniref:Fibronectin type III domain-containing protein n=1 Tax=Candidatus Kentrum sp. DK TaxID=2126562 RepID=A0A450S3Y6_9GAMM|nr:MAG: Fibronectin type III domain-containing protein [Candidatus Kentron sp. DK]